MKQWTIKPEQESLHQQYTNDREPIIRNRWDRTNKKEWTREIDWKRTNKDKSTRKYDRDIYKREKTNVIEQTGTNNWYGTNIKKRRTYYIQTRKCKWFGSTNEIEQLSWNEKEKTNEKLPRRKYDWKISKRQNTNWQIE